MGSRKRVGLGSRIAAGGKGVSVRVARGEEGRTEEEAFGLDGGSRDDDLEAGSLEEESFGALRVVETSVTDGHARCGRAVSW